jgi:uncharacterized alkaline shock family protein YloU
VSGDAIARLVVDAAQETDGARAARPRRGVDVKIEDGAARVQLEVALRYGTVLPDAARNVQAAVAAALGAAAGVRVEAVDVAVVELDG